MEKRIEDMTSEEFDEYFDNGGDVSSLFETIPVERPNEERQVVSATTSDTDE